MEAAARKHPDVKFLQMEQPTLMKNLGAFDLSEEDGFYVAGMMLAAATKHGHIGFVGSFPVPAIVRVVNALQLGAREINPKATVRTVWTNTWYEPAKERQASQSLISSGAEALTDDVGDPVPGQVAEDARVPWVGINVDQSSFAPTSWLTGVVFNYGPYYIQQAKAAMDGTWKPSQSYLRMSDDVVQLAPLGKRYDQEVSAADRKKIDARRKAIASGKQWVFTGPLRDQKGKLRVPAGKRMSIPELQSMNWLVEGVVGSTGKS
jgi:basic membrane protein A